MRFARCDYNQAWVMKSIRVRCFQKSSISVGYFHWQREFCLKATEKEAKESEWPWTDHGGVWTWTLWWRGRDGEPAGGLSENCGRHSTPTYPYFISGRWKFCAANLTQPRTWNCSPEIQRHTHPSRSRPREVSVRVLTGKCGRSAINKYIFTESTDWGSVLGLKRHMFKC